MVINCPECSTKFRVSAEKIPAQGAKLRCARCRHIFHVKPEEEASASPTPEVAVDSSSTVESPQAPQPSTETPVFDSSESASSFNDSPTESDFAAEDNSLGGDDPFGDTDFGFEEPLTKDQDPAASDDISFEDTPADSGDISDSIGFGEEASTASQPDTTKHASYAFGFDSPEAEESTEIGAGVNDEFDASAFEDDTPANDDAFAFDEDYGNVDMGGDDNDQAFSFGDEDDRSDDTFATEQPEPQEEISTNDAAAGFDDSAPFTDSPLEESQAEPYAPLEDDDDTEQALPETVPIRKKRGPFATLILFLLVLIMGIIVAAGVLYWQSGPEAVQQMYKRLTGQEVSVPVKGQIRVKDLQGSFVTNKSAGELLVIQGNATNDFRESRAAIQVKGILFDSEGNQLRQKTIFCGNPISTEDLRTLPFDKLEEIMGNQFGESLVNLNVTPGQVIPFTIVFRDTPNNLSEFVVEVADSNPAAQ